MYNSQKNVVPLSYKFRTMGIRPVADFETLNYQIMTDLNTSTEATITDETAIKKQTI